jgi:hypothetical protein
MCSDSFKRREGQTVEHKANSAARKYTKKQNKRKQLPNHVIEWLRGGHFPSTGTHKNLSIQSDSFVKDLHGPVLAANSQIPCNKHHVKLTTCTGVGSFFTHEHTHWRVSVITNYVTRRLRHCWPSEREWKLFTYLELRSGWERTDRPELLCNNGLSVNNTIRNSVCSKRRRFGKRYDESTYVFI